MTELNELGITTDTITEKLVDRLAGIFVGEDSEYTNDFEKRVETAIKLRVDEILDRAITEQITPKVTGMVDNICLEETNKWGEPKGRKMTFIEYLTERVDWYIREPVNYEGKSKGENSYGSWDARSTRIAFMIHAHLKYHIEQAMVNALGVVNSSVRKGLEEAVNLALKQVTVKVDTTVKS